MIPFVTGTVLPALGVGASSGLASTGVQKLIGNGLYLKKGSGVCRIETDGIGFYLGPTSGKGFETVGNDLSVEIIECQSINNFKYNSACF